jgi:hypothetical protein
MPSTAVNFNKYICAQAALASLFYFLLSLLITLLNKVLLQGFSAPIPDLTREIC